MTFNNLIEPYASLYDLSYAATLPANFRVESNHATLKPFPYQDAAIYQADYLRKHAYCGHHPGAGKTPIALVLSQSYRIDEPVIVICPPSIVYQWAQRAMDWTGHAWYVATTAADVGTILAEPSKMLPARFVVPDSLLHEIPVNDSRFALVIADEAHRLKTRDSRRTRAFYGDGVEIGLAQRADKILALSGTPMPNNPTELYPYLHACYPDIAPNFRTFSQRYCPPTPIWINGRQIATYKTAINKEELGRKLRETCMIRPKRADILGQLPPLRVDTYPLKIKLKSTASVEEIVNVFRQQMVKNDHGEMEVKEKALSTERLHLGVIKAEASIPYLETVIDGGACPVIWCWHREAALIISNALQVPVIMGGQTPEVRRDMIARFVNSGVSAIVCTIQAAGEGIDGFQHRTDMCIYVERSFVPRDIEQTVGRLWRIGQRNSVHVVTIMSDHPMDHAVENMLKTKHADAKDIIG